MRIHVSCIPSCPSHIFALANPAASEVPTTGLPYKASQVLHILVICRYPIVGKRWQCLECLERVGFDLCAACYERRADVVGRFNQHHKAGASAVAWYMHNVQ